MLLRWPEEQWKRNQIAVILAASIVFMGFTFVMPFLPYFVASLGVKGGAIAIWSGILLSISPLLAALLGPFWGRVADRYGMKIMVGRVLLAMTIHWFLMIFVWDVYSLLALRILLGIFSGFSAMSIALITSGCPKESIGRSIGMLQSFQILSVGVGPFIGGILYDLIGLRAACGITSFLCFISFALIVFFYKDVKNESLSSNVTLGDSVRFGSRASHGLKATLYAEDPSPYDIHEGETRRRKMENTVLQNIESERGLRFMEILRIPGILSIIILLFFANLVSRSFSTVTPLFVEMLSRTKENLGLISGITVSFASFAEAASAFILGHLATKLLPKRLVIFSLAGGVLTVFPMAFVQSEYQFLAMRILAGFLTGGVLTVAFTTGGTLFPERSRATSYAILSSSALLGGAIGPMVSGLIAAAHIRITFFAGAAIYLFLVLETLAGIRREEALKTREEAARRKIAGEKPYIPLPR
ncbi:MAG: MFS transporter [Acidobacteriota bacterium]